MSCSIVLILKLDEILTEALSEILIIGLALNEQQNTNNLLKNFRPLVNMYTNLIKYKRLPENCKQ